jgi:O-acetyl-ADP-ribose deacetylase (regulator of RNase III)
VGAIRVIKGDITALDVDAIVNAANSSLMGGGGVDGAIHRAGGPAIVEECREIVARQGPCPPGDAVVTTGGALPAAHVIHTVGPVWSADRAEEHDTTLASCYRRSLEEAAGVGARSVAFPNISTGIYGFPKERAAPIAVDAVRRFLAVSEAVEEVTFVCFDEENLGLYEALLSES